MATISNLIIDQGTTFSTIITLTNQTGTALNLAGYTIASQFRKSYASSTAVSFTATIYEASLGQIRLQLTPEQTSNINSGRYLYDVEITSSSSEKKRALEGLVIITPEITKV